MAEATRLAGWVFGRPGHDGWDHMDGGWGWLFVALMVTFWMLLLGALVWFVVHTAGRTRTHETDRPREILAERYARGEISTEEYRERLEHLGDR